MRRARAIVSIPSGRRTKWMVLVLWVAILAVAGPLAGKLMGAEKNDAQAWLPAQAESTRVLALQSQFLSPNVFPAVVVYDRPGGLTAADRAKATADAGRFRSVAGVVPGQVQGPFTARDGQAIQTVVPVDLGTDGWNKAGPAVDSLRAIAEANGQGLTVHITGPLGTAADSAKSFKGIDSTLLFATLGVVIVLLLFTYRSPVLWLFPVISAGVALTVAQALIYLFAAHAGLTVNAQSAGILDVLVFGAGTDYALLLTARYREELRRHEDRHEAMAVALRRAGPAVVASGGTVIVSLLALTVAELNSTKGMGPVLAIGVAVALLAMMTLLPALLVITGRWVFWPVRPAFGSAEPTSRGLWARIGNGIAARPRIVWVTTALVLGAMALGMTGLKASGLTNAQSFRGHPDSVIGQTVLEQHFPGGGGQPVVIIGRDGSGAQLAAAARSVPGLTAVTPPATRAGHAYLEGTLTAAPDSPAAYTTIDKVRAAVHAVPGADALVGGNTAINLDVQRAAAHDRNLIIPVVLVVVFIILALLLRAVIAPLMLVATVVLSLRRDARGQRAGVRPRLRLRRRGHLVPAVRVRVPGRAGDRLQHLPDDQGPGGGHPARHPARRAERAGRHRRGHHLGRPGAGGHVRGAGHAAGDVPDRTGLRGRVRRAAGHDRGPLGPGHRAQPGHRPAAVVAEPAGQGHLARAAAGNRAHRGGLSAQAQHGHGGRLGARRPPW